MEAELRNAGRTGLFLGGACAVAVLFGLLLAATAVVDDADLALATVAGGAAVGLLTAADRTRRTYLEPLGIMAAFGSTACVAVTTLHLGSATGSDGELLFWTVLVVALPTSVATLLWLPHPVLGTNVVATVVIATVRAPVGAGGLAEAGGKALLLGLVLAGLATLVDLKSRSRVGSLLHYTAVGALAVGKLLVGLQLHALEGAGALAVLALAELAAAVLLRRRSWAVSGWVTLGIAGLAAVPAGVAGGPGAVVLVAIVGLPIAWLARDAHRHREELRFRLLGSCPGPLAAAFPR